MALDPEEDRRRRAARARARYAANPEKYRAKSRAVYEADPGPTRERSADERARKRGEEPAPRRGASVVAQELRDTTPVPVAHTGDRAGFAWRDRAACIGMDTELFFPETTPAAEARAACLSCPVRAECLGFALAFPRTQMMGVWGGTSQHDRARIPRKSRAAVATKLPRNAD